MCQSENYRITSNTEQYLLVLWKGFAFIIEVKASKLHKPFINIEKAIEIIKTLKSAFNTDITNVEV